MSLPVGHCTGTGIEPLESPGQAVGRWLDARKLLPEMLQQEIHHPPGRERTQRRGMQQTLCTVNATHLSAVQGEDWAPAGCLGAREIRANSIQIIK